jgi:hypothetical protein
MAQQVSELVFKSEEINQLDKIISEIPTKYGLPLVNLIQTVAQRRYEESQAAINKEQTQVTAESEVLN